MLNSTDIIVWTLIGANVLLVLYVLYTEVRLKKLLRGKDARTLEDTIGALGSEIKNLQGSRKEVENYLKSVEIRLQKSIQGVETVRFNPFRGTGDGGNQSFGTALVSERGDGIIISTLYVRDRVSVFGKPIKAWRSEFDLTEEEQEALRKAKEAARLEK